MNGVIFDIDGTIVDSFDFDSACYREAVAAVLGDVSVRDDWSKYEHVTDAGILRQICLENGLEFDCAKRVRAKFGDLVAEHLHAKPSACVEIPGSLAFFERLQGDKDFRLGFATGGWHHAALLKLNHVGVRHTGVPIFSSDNHHDRTEIMRMCRDALSRSTENIIYIGDGEWDLEATRVLGWKFIGIGPRLKNKCPVWVPDFTSPGLLPLIKTL